MPQKSESEIQFFPKKSREQIANIAYFVLSAGIIIKFINLAKERK